MFHAFLRTSLGKLLLMTWILEEPIYILILGILTLAFLGFALMQTGYRGIFHAMLGVAALTVGLLILERMVETDKEQIESTLQTIARDVEANDLDAIYGHIYSGAPGILARAKREFPRYTFRHVKIKDNVEVVFENDHQPRKAVVTFNVVVDVRQGAFHHPHVPRFVRVTLLLEEGHWRVAEYSHADPINGFSIPGQ